MLTKAQMEKIEEEGLGELDEDLLFSPDDANGSEHSGEAGQCDLEDNTDASTVDGFDDIHSTGQAGSLELG